MSSFSSESAPSPDFSDYSSLGLIDTDTNTNTNTLYSTPPGSSLPPLPPLPLVESASDVNARGIKRKSDPIQVHVPVPDQRELDGKRARKEPVPRPTPSPPKTAFMWFSLSQTAKYGGVKNGDIDIQAVAEDYKKLSPSQKAMWENEAKKDKIRFTEEKSNYEGPWILPKRRAKKHPLAPKRPMSAFLRYSKCHRNEVKRNNPDVDNTDISKMLGYNWRNSSEQEKEPFVTQELRERAIYKAAIAKWRLVQKEREMNEAVLKSEHMSKAASQGNFTVEASNDARNGPNQYEYHQYELAPKTPYTEAHAMALDHGERQHEPPKPYTAVRTHHGEHQYDAHKPPCTEVHEQYPIYYPRIQEHNQMYREHHEGPMIADGGQNYFDGARGVNERRGDSGPYRYPDEYEERPQYREMQHHHGQPRFHDHYMGPSNRFFDENTPHAAERGSYMHGRSHVHNAIPFHRDPSLEASRSHSYSSNHLNNEWGE